MCNKCEESMASGDDNEETSQVVDYPTDSQMRNLKVINCLNFFCQRVEKIAEEQTISGNPKGTEMIMTSLKDIEKLSRSVIEPLLESTKDAIEAIILTMHHETHFSNNEEVVVTKISPYLRELKAFIQRVCCDFLQPFHCNSLISECTIPLLIKTLNLFIQHASIVR